MSPPSGTRAAVAWPDPLRAALLAEAAGADGITAHLREDRRHIRDADIEALMAGIGAAELRDGRHGGNAGHRAAPPPHAVCIVPERREERTTEGGLDVAGDARLTDYIAPLRDAGCRVSLFIGHDPARSRPRPGSGARWWNCTPAITATCWPKAAGRGRDENLRRCALHRRAPMTWGSRCTWATG
jgi:hypothetical protein